MGEFFCFFNQCIILENCVINISGPLNLEPLLAYSVIFVMCLISMIPMTVLYKPWTTKMMMHPPPLITMVTGKLHVPTVIFVKVRVHVQHFISWMPTSALSLQSSPFTVLDAQLGILVHIQFVHCILISMACYIL